MKRILSLIAFASILVGLAGSLQAQVITTLGTSSAASAPTFSFTPGNMGAGNSTMVFQGMPFMTGAQTYTVDSIVAVVQNTGSQPAMSEGRLYLAASNYMPTGSMILGFNSGTPDPSGSFAQITYTPANPSYTLSANTKYVFVLGGNGSLISSALPPSSSFSWDWTTGGSTVTSGWTMPMMTESTSFNMYPWPNNLGINNFPPDVSALTWTQNTGDTFRAAVNVSAVPEPSTYATIFGVAALGFAGWWRRRRTA